MDATPTLTAGTVTVGPHARASEQGSARAQNIRSCGAMTITPTRQHPRHIGGSHAGVHLRPATVSDHVGVRGHTHGDKGPAVISPSAAHCRG